MSGRLYAGVNLEFPGLPLQHSVHAEQFLITSAAWHGERGLRRIAVNAAPCGHCRQFIAELVTAVKTLKHDTEAAFIHEPPLGQLILAQDFDHQLLLCP